MKNNYLIFDEIDSGIGEVKNFTSLDLLPKIPLKYYQDQENFLEKQIDDDMLIEGISQEIYKSPDYWGLLLVFNEITSFDMLPTNYDTVLERAEEEFENWLSKSYLINRIISEDEKEAKKEEILNTKIEENEKYRYIKYISPDNISVLLAELKTLKNKAAINSDLMIN